MPPNGLPRPGAALLLALVASLLVFRLGSLPLVGPDEPRYARVAVEMHRSGDLVTPRLQGEPWLEKPVLYYWIAAACYALLGENEAAARLPSVLAALLMTGATALVGARLYGGAAGLHAGFAMGTGVLAFVYGHAASMDMLLAATVTAAIGLVGLRLLGLAGQGAIPAACVFIGLATLAKGPIGLLLPALVAGGYVVATRDWSLTRRLLSPSGLLLLLLVAGPWYLLAYRAQGWAFVEVFLLNHNVSRFTSTVHHHPGRPWYYVPILLVGLFPWSGLLLPALASLAPRRSRFDLFVLLWLVLPLAFFSLAGSKLPGYILPCLAPLAILVGRAAEAAVRGSDELPSGSGRRAAALLNLVIAAAVVALPFELWRTGEPAWRLALPLTAWALLLAFSFSRRFEADAAGALRLLRVGASGLLLLVATAAPVLLARRESGRDLFRPARGQEVLAWGAWRAAWMAGYFYNDGNVREVQGLPTVVAAAERGPVLVLCGPAEKRQLQTTASLATLVLAEGPRSNALLLVKRVSSGVSITSQASASTS